MHRNRRGHAAIDSAWAAYAAALDASPLVVKSITACLLTAAADYAAQAIEARRTTRADAHIDMRRVARFALFGLVLQAPWNHFYYQMLDNALPPTADPISATNLAKVAVDQLLQAPLFTAVFFIFLGVLTGQNRQAITQKLSVDWWPTMLVNWKVWIPATCVNIALVPPALRVLYVNVVFFFWAIFLSLAANRQQTPGEVGSFELVDRGLR
jgi:hypothetical protein